MSKRHVHCWKDQGEHVEETEGFDAYIEFAYVQDKHGACMLPRGHVGPHEFTPDDQIGVSFEPKQEG